MTNTFWYLDKFILKFRQIYFTIWANTFYNLDKYILQFGQIHFTIWANTFTLSGFHPCVSSEWSSDQCDQTLRWSTAAWLHCQMLVIFLSYFLLIFLNIWLHMLVIFEIWIFPLFLGPTEKSLMVLLRRHIFLAKEI